MNPIEKIKEIVERRSGVEDLGISSRKRKYIYLRAVSYSLCNVFTNRSLREIGEVFGNKNHATVIHGLKIFNQFELDNNFRDYYEIYLESYEEIKYYFKDLPEIQKAGILDTSKRDYRIKFINYQRETRRVVGKLILKMRRLKSNKTLERLAELNEEDFKNFEERANAFLIMIKQKEYENTTK